MKRLFNTPKKAIISTLCLSAVILAAAVAVPTIIIRSSLIGRDEAERTALADAGLDAAEVSGCRTELDFEDGHFQYEIDFYSNGTEYEYLILAKDGGIISRDTDGSSASSESWNTNAQTSQKAPAAAENAAVVQNVQNLETPADSTLISIEEAKAAAVQSIGAAETDVTFTKTRLDRDDFIQVYDIEFYTAEAEYEFEINAVNGSVHEWKTEQFPAAVISPDTAMAAALTDTGLTKDDVTFTRTELDSDDRHQIYEIEFYTAQAEYEYKIDAVDGTIWERTSDSFLVQTGTEAAASPSSDSCIGIDEAKNIAVSHAGLSVDAVQFSKAKLENDDGRMEYEIEFFSGITEYEYDIDAVSGQILTAHSELA